MNRLRVVTINIAGMHFDWFEKRRDVLIANLRELSPDIIFLQETTFVDDQRYDQSLDIAGATGLKAIAIAPYGNNREFESPILGGIAILSKFPFTLVQHRKLPPTTSEDYGARVALMGKISKDDQEIILATTHLSWRPEESELRHTQTIELLNLIRSDEGIPVILAGDFNATPEEPSVRAVLRSYKDTFSSLHPQNDGITWSSDNNFIRSRKDRRIDYIFCSNEMKVEKAEVILNSKQPVFPSDHFGVLADIILL